MPRISALHLGVIVDALKRSLDQLVAEHGSPLAAKDENELNALLQARLNSLCGQEKLLSLMVASVVRGGEAIGFDGTQLELRPDLGIHLTGRNRNFPLIVECKIIDAPDRKGIDLYCSNGIRRFVDGEYAWASSQGLMLGYIRDGSSVLSTLTPCLVKGATRRPDPLRTKKMPQEERLSEMSVWVSCHGRSFRYIGPAAGSPGAIDISHLWFDLPRVATSPSARKPNP